MRRQMEILLQDVPQKLLRSSLWRKRSTLREPFTCRGMPCACLGKQKEAHAPARTPRRGDPSVLLPSTGVLDGVSFGHCVPTPVHSGLGYNPLNKGSPLPETASSGTPQRAGTKRRCDPAGPNPCSEYAPCGLPPFGRNHHQTGDGQVSPDGGLHACVRASIRAD